MVNTLTKRLKRKIRDNAFMLSLSVGSFIGFIINTFIWFSSTEITFQWLSVVLGIGLVYEGKMPELLKTKSFKNIGITKVITIAIGFVVLVGGLMTLPFLQFLLSEKISGAIGVSNVIAVFVIGAEIFFID